MAILYKHFRSFRTAPLLILGALFLCFLCINTTAQAQNSVFTVEGIQVDVTASDALKARDQAFGQAQQDAFKALAQRMMGEAEAQSLALPPTSTISTLIQDYEVTEEKLSAVRYIGTYTFRFRERAVKQYFSGSGVQYSDVSSRPTLVLPYYQTSDRTILWSPQNEWMQAWSRAQSLNGLVPVVVPLGDLEDVRDISDEDSLTYRPENLQAMLGRYGAGEAVIAVAVPAQGGQSVTINIYRTDRTRPEYVHQLVQNLQPGQNEAELFDSAVKRVFHTLQKDWKQKTMVRPRQQANRLEVRVPIKSLKEWTDTRRALQGVQGVEDIVVKSLTPTGAQVELLFQGDEHRLRLALRQADMTLTSPRFSAVGLGSGQNGPSTYELYMNRYAPSLRRY